MANSTIPKAQLQTIITGSDVESAHETIAAAESLAKVLVAERLTNSQIRNVFGEVRRIEMKWPTDENNTDKASSSSANRDLILLKSKLGYQAHKRGNQPVKTLADVLIQAIDLVNSDRQRFQRFIDFFEAILAYHKVHGGQEN